MICPYEKDFFIKHPEDNWTGSRGTHDWILVEDSFGMEHEECSNCHLKLSK